MANVSALKYGLGLLSMVVCIVGWVASRFLIQKINLVYPKPYLLSYLANSSRILYFIIILIWGDFLIEDQEQLEEDNNAKRWKNSLKIAAWMTPLQGLLTFCNQVTYSTLSVSTGSVLFNSNPIFLIGIGWSLGWEHLTVLKLLAATVAASSLVLLASKEITNVDGDLGWKGVVAALGSALSFAVISLLLKRHVMDLKRASMIEAYGWVGLLILLIGWPIIIILHYTGWEPFALPPKEAIPLIIANSLVGTFAFNLSWLVAFAWTSELVVAIGMGLALPLTFFADMLLNDEHIGWVKWLSLLISLVAFLLINIATRLPQWDYKIGK